MIKSKKDLKYYIQEDSWRNSINYSSLIGKLKYIFKLLSGNESARAFRYLKCLRHLEYHLNHRTEGVWQNLLFYYYKFHLNRLGVKYHIQIPPNAVGYGLAILHLSGGGGVLLNVKKMGNYCAVNSGVLLGNIDTQDNRVTTGDFVAFAPGAKAFGKLDIGNNVFVASNAVVTKDVNDNSIVAGIPAKYIKEKKPSQILKKRPMWLK